MNQSSRPLRICLVSPPMVPVPPRAYAGTERVVAALIDGLTQRGHEVTLIGPGDSTVECELIPSVEQSLWSTGYTGDVANYVALTLARAWEHHARFDIIHSHCETLGFLFARHCPTPVVSTLHGRLDNSGIVELMDEFRDIPLVAISESQRRWHRNNRWLGAVHHGLPMERMPFGARPGPYIAVVGRVSPEKGIAEAIDLSRRTGIPLRIAAKMHDPAEHAYYREVVEPALEPDRIEFLGELEPDERDGVFAGALATLMLGGWPEPFGLVAIESLACGTPVIARRAGALPEIVEHEVDGFIVDDLVEAELALRRVSQLDRARIRQRSLERFSVLRMTDEYERIYRELIREHQSRRLAPLARQLEPDDSATGDAAADDGTTDDAATPVAPTQRPTDSA